MVHLKMSRFPLGKYDKLKHKKIGPYQILQKIGDNTYILDLPSDIGISSTFNAGNLII